MTTADWLALPHLIALGASGAICLAGLFLAAVSARACWQWLTAFHQAGMARVERLADPKPMPGETCGCGTVRDEHGQTLPLICPQHDPCADPPCNYEEDYDCANHRLAERIGKHRAVWGGSLDDLDAPTIHEITDKAWGKR